MQTLKPHAMRYTDQQKLMTDLNNGMVLQDTTGCALFKPTHSGPVCRNAHTGITLPLEPKLFMHVPLTPVASI